MPVRAEPLCPPRWEGVGEIELTQHGAMQMQVAFDEISRNGLYRRRGRVKIP
jgi:hypothetical protein